MFVETPLLALDREHTLAFNVDDTLLLTAAHCLGKLQDLQPNERCVRYIKLLDAYNTATIEGAVTTLEEVLSDKNGKSEIMVKQSLAGLQYAIEHPFTLQEFINAWSVCIKDCCENVSAGIDGFRVKPVYIGSRAEKIHEPAKPEMIETFMRELFNYHCDSKILEAIVHSFYIDYVHPFADGNGRISRITIQRILEQPNIPIATAVSYNLRGYYAAFRKSEQIYGDHLRIDNYVEYMLRMVIQACELAELYHQPLSDDESKVLNRINKEGRGYVGYGGVCKILDCNPQYAANVISSLHDKGYLTFDFKGGSYKLLWR